MSTVKHKRGKKNKHAKAAPPAKPEKEPEAVTRSFGDNTCTGIIKDGPLGSQYIEGQSKYTWQSGIKYEGAMVSSTISGKGRFEWPDGSSYVGELLRGRRHGQGVYVGADAVTRYEGQWLQGKRHGHGRVSYSMDGTAFYDGDWQDGQKHGHGKQVWPSGNSYEGQWARGHMHGKGRMTWQRENGATEMYEGMWEDSLQHGQGTHTWLDAERLNTSPKFGGAGKGPQQQQNRYEGQWHRGKRSGFGSFYYANGANYTGEWRDHVKCGQGRHTLEDGRVYEGPFDNDHFVGDGAPPVLPPGANPVTNLIDVTDLKAFTFPADAGGLAASKGIGYTDAGKVLNEVSNSLLRYIGELRDIYKRYVGMWQLPSEDPFGLRTYQFWELARDAGLLGPHMSVASLTRAVRSGPRHHREVAAGDMEDLRPLTPVTPRPPGREELQLNDASCPSSARGAQSLASPASRALSKALTQGSEMETEGEVSEDEAQAHQSEEADGVDSLLAGLEQDPALQAAELEERAALRRAEVAFRLGGKFCRWSCLGSSLVDVHDPLALLLFRHFLEGMVRASPLHFPMERGLESQVLRILEERLVPLSRSEACDAEGSFSFLAQPSFQEPLKEFGPALVELFRSALPSPAPTLASASLEQDAEEERPPGEVEQQEASGGRDLHVLGLPRRQYHVASRVIQTIRLKDALQLLDAASFLKQATAEDLPLADAECPAFLAEESDFQGLDDEVGQETQQLTQDFASSIGEAASAASAMPKELAEASSLKRPSGQSSKELLPVGGELPVPAARDSAARTSIGGPRSSIQLSLPLIQSQRRPSKRPSKIESSAFKKHSFFVTTLQVIRLAAEVLSPDRRSLLRWQHSRTAAPPGVDERELVSLLEYMETELTFPEFVRLLVRMADLGMDSDPELCEKVDRGGRFGGFLRYVFLPATKGQPHVPEEPPQEEQPEPSLPAEGSQANAGDAAAPEQDAGGEAVPEEPQEEEQEAAEAPALVENWLGFRGEAGVLLPGAASSASRRQMVPRRWPDEYETEVLAW